MGANAGYATLNSMSSSVMPGSEGVRVLPFGNGAERMLGNRQTGMQFSGIDLNHHGQAHLFRAIQEGIAFAFRYGLDIMRENGLEPRSIRAGRANLFLSDVFLESFVAATGVPVTLYPSDGSVGAALGAGIGCGYYTSENDAFAGRQPLATVQPDQCPDLEGPYNEWLNLLNKQLS